MTQLSKHQSYNIPGTFQRPTIQGDPICCGAGILYNFVDPSHYYSSGYKWPEDWEWSQDFYQKCISHPYGLITAILANHQMDKWHKRLINAGFVPIIEKEPNPNHHGQTQLTLYVWQKTKAIPYIEAHPIKPVEKKEELKPVEKPKRPIQKTPVNAARVAAGYPIRFVSLCNS